MGGVRDALKYYYTLHRQRAMSATVLVVLAFVLPVSQTSSDYTICQTHKNNVKLFPFDTVYFGTNSSAVSVRVYAADCVNEKQFLKLVDFTESNETLENDDESDVMKWYEFNYCGNNVARIGSIMRRFEHTTTATSSSGESHCRDKPVTLRMRPNVVLAKRCTEGVVRKTRTKIACLELLEGATTGSTDTLQEAPNTTTTTTDTSSGDMIWKLLDELSLNSSQQQGTDLLSPLVENQEPSIFIKDGMPELFEPLPNNPEPKSPLLDSMTWPKNYDELLDSITVTPPNYNLHDTNYFGGHSSTPKTRHYKENAIPIFIGIVVFSISMCLRFCLCRAKSVVRRVTTVTVIRSVGGATDGTQDHQQDPPPSYVDVVSNPSHEGDSEPPPPAYADIIDDVNLPTYSEVEAQNMHPREEVALSEQNTQGTDTNAPCDPADSAPPDGKGTPPTTKNALTKYRSQHKQFSFKVLDEDE